MRSTCRVTFAHVSGFGSRVTVRAWDSCYYVEGAFSGSRFPSIAIPFDAAEVSAFAVPLSLSRSIARAVVRAAIAKRRAVRAAVRADADSASIEELEAAAALYDRLAADSDSCQSPA